MDNGFIRTNPTDQTKLQGRILAVPQRATSVIAIVHGFGEHTGRYAGVAPLLSEAGHVVMGLDLHGHGRTSGKRGIVTHYERLREDVDALIDEATTRYPELPIFLWGHSMGGGLVLDYVLDRGAHEVTGVIVTAPLIRAVDPPPALFVHILRALARIFPTMSLRNSIPGEKISTIAEEQTLYESDTLNHDRLGVRLADDMLRHGAALPGKASRFVLPLLLMHARGDQLTDFAASEEFARSCPNCNFLAFENVEHEIHNDRTRQTVVSEISTFIEGLL